MKYVIFTVAALLVVSISALIVYKPARVVVPEVFGVSCEYNICIDDHDHRDFVTSLVNTVKLNLEKQQGLSIGEPKIIFCSSGQCRDTFGLGQKAGFTLGSSGIVIAPRGWKEHYVAHELVHFWQAENYGSLVLLKGEPWLIEGMAYALSNDPRERLHEPFESYRRRFNEWHRLNAGIPLKKSVGEALAE